jgi:hypothetical protein
VNGFSESTRVLFWGAAGREENDVLLCWNFSVDRGRYVPINW